jgi:SulP family sulfate permease
MRRTDALAFLCTAIAVLVVNAVLAVALGCSFYAVHYLYERWIKPVPLPLPQPEQSQGVLAGSAR